MPEQREPVFNYVIYEINIKKRKIVSLFIVRDSEFCLIGTKPSFLVKDLNRTLRTGPKRFDWSVELLETNSLLCMAEVG